MMKMPSPSLLLLAVTVLFSHSRATTPSLAKIITIPANTAPSPPPGLKNSHGSEDRPGVKIGSLTLHEYSYIDNRYSMQIIAYDEQGNLVEQWEKTGARYMTSISLGDDGSIIFTGQSDRSVKLTCADLKSVMFKGIVSVETVSKDAVPAAPADLKLGFPFLIHGSGPAIKAGRLTIYEYSYMDNRYTMKLLAYDETQTMVESWDKNGARYMSSVTEDVPNYELILVGQSDKTTKLTWDDLCPSPTTTTTTTTTTATPTRPPTVTYYGGTDATWEGAKQKCEENGDRLAKITSTDENDRVAQACSTYFCWTGLNDRAQEGQFVWLDGSTPSYTNWAPGEPNNKGPNGESQQCAGVLTRWRPKKWDDRICSKIHGYVCESWNNAAAFALSQKREEQKTRNVVMYIVAGSGVFVLMVACAAVGATALLRRKASEYETIADA